MEDRLIGTRGPASTAAGESSGHRDAVPFRRGKKIMIVAGEPSGDLQAGALGEALLRLDPTVSLMGIGGRRLRTAGARLLFDSSSWGAIGIFDALVKIPPIAWIFWQACRVLKRERPDVLVLVDCPAFNMRLASVARGLGIPAIYFFPPSQWSRDPKRVRRIAERVTRVVAAFPFTADAYRAAGLPVEFFGHPLLDLVRPTRDRATFCREFGIGPEKRLVALLPGSRDQEIRYLLPVLLETAGILHRERPDLHFLLPIATDALEARIRRETAKRPRLPLTLARGETYDMMSVSDLLLVASGSATLEAACLRKPMVIVYRLSWLSWLLAKLVVKWPYAGLPNLIAGRRIVPELLQGDAEPGRIAKEALGYLSDPSRCRRMAEELERLVGTLGEPGAIHKVAKLVLEAGSVEGAR